MTSQPPLPAGDARQPDALDAFLDALAGGAAFPPRDLDPTLAATVHHVHGLAHQLAADSDRAGKAHRWEDLMRTPTSPFAVTPFPTTATLPASSAPRPTPLRPVMRRQSRLRRLGNQSLGLVATLTLVLLVAASSLAVYLTAPQGGDEPTMFPAGYGGSPEATPSDAQPSPDVVNLADYPDLRLPFLTTCLVPPRSLEALSSVLGIPIVANDRATPRLQPDPVTSPPSYPVGESPFIYREGDGATPVTLGHPDTSTISAVTEVWSTYRSCEVSNESRRSAALVTDDYLLRYYFRNGPDVVGIAQLSNEPRTGDRLRQLNQSDDHYLADFQVLESGKVRASLMYVGLDSNSDDILYVNGYVFFSESNGTWLVDQIAELLG